MESLSPSMYLTMDSIISDSVIDSVTLKQIFKYNSTIMSQNHSVTNKAVCFNNTEDFPFNQDTFQCDGECSIILWLRHFCEPGIKKSILLTPVVTLQCSELLPLNLTFGSIEILTENCAMKVDVPIGFWYQLSMTVSNGDLVQIQINSDLLKKDCSVPSINTNPMQFGVGSGSELCIDEFMAIERSIEPSQLTELYNIYLSGMNLEYLSVFNLDEHKLFS